MLIGLDRSGERYRMKTPAIPPILLLFLLAGCAPGPTHYWYHPDKTLEQAKEDYRECKSRAQDEAGEAVADDHLVRARSRSRSSDEGWEFYDERVGSVSSWGAMYQQNVFEGCMQGKGYLKVRDYRLPSGLRTKSYSLGGIAGQ